MAQHTIGKETNVLHITAKYIRKEGKQKKKTLTICTEMEKPRNLKLEKASKTTN